MWVGDPVPDTICLHFLPTVTILGLRWLKLQWRGRCLMTSPRLGDGGAGFRQASCHPWRVQEPQWASPVASVPISHQPVQITACSEQEAR
jgi:hypothetical protein